MKDINLSLQRFFRAFREFIRRYHVILFFLGLSILTITAGLITLSIISDKTQTGQVTSTINSNFDTDTMKRVQELNPSAISTPSGRTNPFVE